MATAYKSYWSGSTSGKNREAAASATSGDGAAFVGESIKLCEAESRHLVKVFRAREGDAVTLFNAAGDLWQGQLLRADGRAALVRVLAHERIAAPRPQITLGQALPKGKTMDSVIAAMVELGVARVVPLATDCSEVRLEKDPARAESKREHWQQTAIEASKQSSNFYGTRIEPIATLKAFLEQLPAGESAAACAQGDGSNGGSSNGDSDSHHRVADADKVGDCAADLRIIGSLEEGAVPLAALAPEIAAAGRVTCLIGPEGDFSPAEYALARAHGFRPVRLAAHVLRVKTAATYIVSTIDALAKATVTSL